MNFPENLPLTVSLLAITFFAYTHAATFDIVNQCNYTVWAAASPGGGRRLDQGQSWSISIAPGTTQARIWGRTNCTFDANGRCQCETGDCNGLLECQGFGRPPNTLAEFALNQPNNMDFFDISIVDGFNIPMELSPTDNGCRRVICNGPIVEQCPDELHSPGGCNNPCTVFNINEYCCTEGPGTCGPTTFSRFFKDRCPDTYSYPLDDQTSLFTCSAGTNYRVVFCP
ncbi:unnamed protein product [Fraxinus pennsylvanica]|uniref:Thaumatin-like protein n=1 Tax=Fraxinus pennsylvanica TaxID=56036 RepID=A0AAD1Z150_9LAMI|nr:unnamed protein product [Fraxinus pennsylvanica]